MPSLPLVHVAGVAALLGDVGDLDARVVDLAGDAPCLRGAQARAKGKSVILI